VAFSLRETMKTSSVLKSLTFDGISFNQMHPSLFDAVMENTHLTSLGLIFSYLPEGGFNKIVERIRKNTLKRLQLHPHGLSEDSGNNTPISFFLLFFLFREDVRRSIESYQVSH